MKIKGQEVDEQEFIEFYNSHTLKDTAKEFKISIHTIYAVLEEFNITKKQDIPISNGNEIIEFYKNHTKKETCEKFNILECVLKRIIKKLNFKKDTRKYKIYNEEFIKLCENHTQNEIAEKIGCSQSRVSNICRRLNLPRKNNRYKDMPEDFNFTSRQKEIINGMLLGDGTITKQKTKNSNCRFEYEHALKQNEYLEKIATEFGPIKYNIREIERGKIIGEYNNKIVHSKEDFYISNNIETIAHPLFTELERKWYLRDENGEYILKPVGDNGKMERIKIVPKDLVLTPLTVAIWFFDDGYNNVNKKLAGFSTDGFTREECCFLTKKLNEFNIDCKIYEKKNRNGKAQYYINIFSKSYINLINLIKPYNIYNCIQYKTDLPNYIIPFCDDFSRVAHNNTSGIRNLYWDNKSNKFIAHITINKHRIHFGCFKEEDKDLAISILKKAFDMRNNGIKDPEEYKKLKYMEL